MTDTGKERDEADLRWCDSAAESIMDELLIAKLIAPDQVEWAHKIIAQDLYIQLVSGRRPPN